MVRVFVDRRFLLILTVLVFGVSAWMTGAQILELLGAGAEKRSLIIIEQEETIALLVVVLGCLLEGRETIARRLVPQDSEEEALNEACAYYGFLLLMGGLFVEAFDQVLGCLKAPASPILYAGLVLDYCINVWVFGLMGRIGWRLALPKS